MNNFFFKGGVHQHTKHHSEKMLLYFLTGGRETSFYNLKQTGIIKPSTLTGDDYCSPFDICKIFVFQSGFGIPKKYYSFYFHIKEEGNFVKILPFSLEKTGYEFKAKGNFLKVSQVKKYLSSDSSSYSFLSVSNPLPIATLKSMVTINRESSLHNVRKIRSLI